MRVIHFPYPPTFEWVKHFSKILEFDIFLLLVIFYDFLGQSWVTRKKKHARYVLRKWIWLISNWSHANVVTRFEHYSLPNRWTRANAELLLLFPICTMFHSLEFSQSTDVFGAGITWWKWLQRTTLRVAAQSVVQLMTQIFLGMAANCERLIFW